MAARPPSPPAQPPAVRTEAGGEAVVYLPLEEALKKPPGTVVNVVGLVAEVPHPVPSLGTSACDLEGSIGGESASARQLRRPRLGEIARDDEMRAGLCAARAAPSPPPSAPFTQTGTPASALRTTRGRA